MLIFFLAKYIDAASVGYYGLFVAAVGYSIYFVGLDFYTYVTREVISAPVGKRGQMLKSQAALSGILYLTLWPIGVAFLIQSGWPMGLVWWFFPMLILEHFNQEVSRYLIAMSEQISASVILFVRQGSWAMILVALMAWDPSTRCLGTVMTLWALAGIAAAAIGILKLRQLHAWAWHLPIDWGWIKKGLRVCLALLVATLALRGMQTIDRYWLAALGGIEIVAAYVLFFGIAGTLLTFLDAGIFAFAYPALIRLAHTNNHIAAREKVLQMLRQTVFLSAAFALCSWLALPYLLDWIGSPVYLAAKHWYPWLLLAMTLNALSMVPHYALYARGQDRQIIYSHVGSVFVFVLAVLFLCSSYGSLAIPVGLNISFAFILVWKSVAYLLANAKYPVLKTGSQFL